MCGGGLDLHSDYAKYLDFRLICGKGQLITHGLRILTMADILGLKVVEFTEKSNHLIV